jgi:nicotinate-nucleotide pyrophosphorylase (carboxylating)
MNAMTNEFQATTVASLPTLLIEPMVREALLEDLGRAGDITSTAIIPAEQRMKGVIASRKPGVIAGTDAAVLAFRLIDPSISATVLKGDGSTVRRGDAVIALEGPARSILTAERVALNFLCQLSGVATATAALVAGVVPHRASIVCTRKTTPGLRILEKHAVRAGGGSNHRFGLDDAVLIKDNHVAVAGGIRPAIERAKRAVGHLVKIEVEVDSLAQLEEALAMGADAVLLDNMTVDQMREAVKRVDGRMLTEASGGITPESVGAIAATGVDLISSGWITHSAPALDLGLDAVA